MKFSTCKALFLAIFASLSLFSATVSAETYHFTWLPAASDGNTSAGRAKSFDILYNDETKLLSWVVNFLPAPSTNYLPEGFQLAFNNGPNPKGFSGELAFFYFDAKTLSDPKLTVYAYNGVSENSWADGGTQTGNQTPDKILSSKATPGSPRNPTGWIKQLISRNESNGTRTLGFVIDVTRINSHIPLYPSAMAPWKGAAFDTKIGIWFHPVKGLSTSYGTDGFLTNWQRSIRGFYDTANQVAIVEDPTCTGISGNKVVKVGQPFSTSFTGIDKQGQNLTVTYTGLPVGSTVSPAHGAVRGTPVTATFSFTPNGSHHGKSYNIEVIFTDPVGAKAICPFSVSVPANQAPQCKASKTAGAYQNLSCSAETTKVILDGSSSIDNDNTGPLTYQWSTNCPGASISNPQVAKPTMTFASSNPDGSPVVCAAFLTVSDGYAGSNCMAAVSVQGCVRDCAGTINGDKVIDQCGICDGDGTSCLDCAGIPFGTAKVDRCGICGGNDACVDCKDVPNGPSTLDRCGVCDGDGQSCLGCVNKDIFATLVEMDNGAAKQRQLVKKASARLKKISTAGTDRSLANKSLAEANRLRQENWELTWTINRTQTNCTNGVFCVSISNQSTLDEYNNNAAVLRDLALQVMERVSELRGETVNAADQRLIKKIEAEFTSATGTANTVPSSTSVCS